MAGSREPEHVIVSRGGAVLGKKTILKSDHFPGCQNKRLLPHIEGAPNYRQVGGLPVYGVAIPTVEGIRQVLELIGARKNGGQRVLWHNLREEPVVYINGRPFVLREIENPFTNLEYTGINRARVEQMEARLKHDVLREASRYQNKVMVSDELPDGQMVDQWEPIGENSVQTPLEVYEMLQAEGYLLDYERVPITDEKSPKERDFDLLVQRVSQVEKDTALIFNCQMGRGRTTTGMVIATLVHLRRAGSSGIPRTSSTGVVHELAEETIYEVPDTEESLRRGEYTVIRSLIRVLEGGAESKREVDKVIDKCSAMQNLREAIIGYRNSIQKQADEKKREAALSYFVEYLERYYFLICFAVYIHTDQTALLQNRVPTFQQWMRARPELYSILRRLLRRDPMGALGYVNNYPGLVIHRSSSSGGRPKNMETVVASRNGQVLGRQTVLKSDHCPGCQNSYLPERVEGAPNFREVAGVPVYGVANPTIDGIRAVLHRVGSGVGGRPVLWHNMREEPVVYINGKPFVLREVERPYKNMLEYSGINRKRVEQMEARLKEDILREADRYDSAIMVNHETDDGQIFDAWEPVDPDSVMTPLEVYKSLEAEGFPVEYARVPITDGKAPKSSDFDTLSENIASASKNTAFVFNCQMGRGRTTTGTVIACLVQLRCQFGRPLRTVKSIREGSGEDDGSSSGDEAAADSPMGSPTVIKAPKVERQKAVTGFVLDDIPIVRKITRLLENGVECRDALDAVIDVCAAMQNIRQAVLQYRRAFNQQNLEPHVRRAALNRGVEYLERYFMLIAFSAYLGSPAFDGFCEPGLTGITFKQWLRQRPEVRQMKWSMRLRPSRVFTITEDYKTSENSEGGDVMEAIVKSRIGSVLGKRAILKMYFFPGQKTSSDHLQIPGAPHVVKVEGVNVHSLATPSVDGAKALLSYLKSHSKAESAVRKAVVTDLREEVVVYIHGNPFVLRELDQPVSTLKHVGITGAAVEQMERRLKEDILAEASRNGGRMLLHREEFSAETNQSDVVGYWETVTPDDVNTSFEVYQSLKAEGYNIDYKRIPLTRERAALASDVDAIQSRLDMTGGEDVEYCFVSHTGHGGVAYAMAITCLKLEARSQLHSLAASSSSTSDLSFPPLEEEAITRPMDDEEAFRVGDYRDILSLTRVLAGGPASKKEVDAVIKRCERAGNLREDIYYYKKQLDECDPGDEERYSFLDDMGVKALRRYFYLIAFRSYLYHKVVGQGNVAFTTWMQARPELGHLCDNLKLE
ncbi:hypothetical protein R1flu_005668 [Riccia fluitans]|uniref:Paladin n=1 Tax=Riccia fluitans TaxID=41844 RepID=A0ABD1YTT6_9MARC